MCVFLLHHCIHPVICCPAGCLLRSALKSDIKKYTFTNIHNSVYYIQGSIKREKERKKNGRHWGKSFPNSVRI